MQGERTLRSSTKKGIRRIAARRLPGDEHMCGLLQCSLYGTRDAAENGEEELASTPGDLKLTRGSCACGKVASRGEHIVATVHGDDITIGGERSAVELLVKMMSRKYEIKKQVTGEGADLEKIGTSESRSDSMQRGQEE